MAFSYISKPGADALFLLQAKRAAPPALLYTKQQTLKGICFQIEIRVLRDGDILSRTSEKCTKNLSGVNFRL